MTRGEIERLLARYSSGEITREEREALFSAALEDQALFEELFAEDSLREAFEDLVLRAAVQRASAPARRRWHAWYGWATAVAAASVLLGVFVLRRPAMERRVELAQSKPAAAPVAAPAPAAKERPPVPPKIAEEVKPAPERKQTELRKFSPPPAVAADKTEAAPLPPPPVPAMPLEIVPRQAEERLSAVAPSNQVAPPPAPPVSVQSRVAQTLRAKAVSVAERDESVPSFTATLEWKQPDGSFQAVQPDQRLPRGAVLRLSLSAAEPMVVTVGAPVNRAVRIAAGPAFTVDLPLFESGEHALRLTAAPPGAAGTLGFRAAPGAAAGARLSKSVEAPQEIRFHIE
jgi:hypothetical protein